MANASPTKTSFSNTPQAKDDAFTYKENGGVYYLNVLSNDLGGAAKSLYSIGNGSSANALLNAYASGTEYFSAKGARIAIETAGTNAGMVSYNGGAAFDALAQGQTMTDTFAYAIRLGNGTLSWATATLTVTGTNDAPIVTSVVTGNAIEDGTQVTLNALANASDLDAGTVLNVTNVPSQLPAGVSYDAATKSFTLDASVSTYQNLAHGETALVTVSYGVTDGIATTPANLSWTVTGTNDAPVISGVVQASAVEDGGAVVLKALANASDVDNGAVLTVVGLPASLPDGVSFDANTQSFTLDPAHSAYQSLAAGQTKTVTVLYGVSDGIATTETSASWTITGTNDTPVVSGAVSGDVAEDGGSVTLNALANASDIDAGTVLEVINVPAELPAGVSYDSVSKSFTVDASNVAYQSLAAGQQKTVTVNYEVTDGMVSVGASASWTITGTNDAPVVSGTVTGNATEDGEVSVLQALANASDIDQAASLTVINLPETLPVGVSFDAATQTFALNPADAGYQSLAEGQELTVSVEYGVTDGTAVTDAKASWTIVGKNDAATIAGTASGNVKEDTTLVATGTLNVTDVDSPQTVKAQTNVAGNFGSFSVAASGQWTYTLANSSTAVQALNTTDNRSDSFTVVSEDGTASKLVTVNIAGLDDNRSPLASNDTITVSTSGTVITEDQNAIIRVLANDSDPDGDVLSIASVSATSQRGATISINNDGTLRYNASASSELQALKAGQSLTDTFTYTVKDSHGAISNVATASVVVQGVNDAATISGTSSGNVKEDTTTTVSGKLDIADLDLGEAAFTAQTNANSTYGKFSIDANGNWTYALNNSAANVQALGHNQTVYDSFNVSSKDGSASSTVSVAIAGTNDAPTAAGDTAMGSTLTFEYGTYSTSSPYINGAYRYTVTSGDYTFTSSSGNDVVSITSSWGANNSYALYTYGWNGAAASVNMVKTDGGSFALDSVNVTGYGYSSNNMVDTITGYYKGVQVAQKVVSVPDTSIHYNSRNNVVTLDGSAWDQLDKVVFSISKTGGYSNYTYEWIDNIVTSNTVDTELDINVLANDFDVDQGSTLKVGTFSALSTHGAAVTLNANGTLHYDPTASTALAALASGASVTDTFTYQTVDQFGALSDIATVTISLIGVQ